MPIDIAKTRKLLAAFEFKSFFIDVLGWNLHDARLEITIDGRIFILSAVAEKCGMSVFICHPSTGGLIPDYPTRRKIERQVAKNAYEHLIIFVDGKRTSQVWQWVRREQGKPSTCREHSYRAGQPGDSLIQKLQALAVSLEEEEFLTLPDVTGRARKAFDIERVTKRFYDRFKTEHSSFLEFLTGIPDEALERWYVSVMLNRLMFVYFIQKKRFLNSDLNYLKNKLAQCRRELGKDRFYQDFLCPLFFEGFAKRKNERSEKTGKLLGEVPYLNGGIFMPHQIEQCHGRDIKIPDKAFDKLFEFFDAYQWHLDERPLKKDDEINPDVLGYIFEKYINQKQMGAYYTKEDITEYIGKSTVIPFLFDTAKEKCKIAFEESSKESPSASVWRLLYEDPDRYFFPAVKHGLDNPLPPEIKEGLDTTKPDLIDRRKPWNKAAPPEYALPTEIWREVISRRKHYEEIRGKLAAGEVRSINDLITYNLDIRQFAQDVIENAEGPELLVAFWKAIESVTVLDPTCGSGAFLFAALNILEPLYEACLERMKFFLEEWGADGRKNHPNYHKRFDETLKRVEDHPNHRYFILKSIIVNNLYGVDIMEEAVEICKLRLFLKLVAQIEQTKDIEPLPDIDFNIRAGNTLVGFASLEEVRRAAESESSGQSKLIFGEVAESLRRIDEEADIANRAFQQFRKQQMELGGTITAEDKKKLSDRLGKLSGELDRYLASEYGINTHKIPKHEKYEEAFAKWCISHKPFHWFVEFFGILKAGGFDVIIGNPPYVVYTSEKVPYTILQQIYRTFDTKNLYAYVYERSLSLGKRVARVGLIVQLTVLSAERLNTLQDILIDRGLLCAVSFPRRPESIFDGVEMPVAILISSLESMLGVSTSRVFRFYSEERNHALAIMQLASHNIRRGGHRIAKIGTDLERIIYKKVADQSLTIERLSMEESPWLLYYQEASRYWVKAGVGMPFFRRDGGKIDPPHGRTICFASKEAVSFTACLANSSLFYWFYSAFSDCEHINDALLREFPVPHDWDASPWTKLYNRIEQDLASHSKRKTITTKQGHTIEYDEMKALLSKSVIDEIDFVLARHYSFTEEELDFIINYDIKYRMGQEAEENGKE